MSTTKCQYHATLPARWRCTACELNLCTQCAPKAAGGVPDCPSCRASMHSLGIGNVITPFWERIPRFFLYPAKPDSLMVIMGIAALGYLQYLPMIGLVANLVVSIVTIRFSYRILYHTALGHLEPPSVDQKSEFSAVFWQQIAIFVVFFGMAGIVGAVTGSALLGFVALATVVLALPAAIMTLAIEESLGSALNPLKLLHVATSIGRSYLLLWVMLVLLMGGQQELFALAAPFLPPWVGFPAYNFVSAYFSVAMFHMMGYVVYQYHEPLGFSGVQEFTEAPSAGPAAASLPPPDRAQILITEGKYEEAAAELFEQLERNPDDLALHERYNQLLMAQEDFADGRGPAHADYYLGKLMAQKRRDKALEVYRRSVRRWRDVPIKDGGDAVALAALCVERRDSKLGLPILSRFEQRFPGHAQAVEAQLLAAEMLMDGMGRDEMARQILQRITTRQPDHPLRQKAERLLATLERLQQRKVAAAPSS